MTATTAGRSRRPNGAAPTERRNRDSAVIAAAITVMSQKGYAATSIQEVADRVGVLKGSLYHYFRSKEELLFRILEESHEQVVEIEHEVAALDLSAFEELLEYVRRSSTWYLSNIDRANIFFSERNQLTGDRLTEAQAWGRAFEKHIAKLLTSAQTDGDVRSDMDQRLLTRFVLGALNNIRFWPSRSGKSFSNDEMAAALVSLTRSAIAAP
ncbi:TetR/AcrR family transcriptional regulator [Georgenia thermotolerans]|uniref:TetR family transcriptional regulator n=1 Tax=Georgenia thermotolerans TaxID=527326 RepID=A0A7J5UUG0_9MICO|nr:TetR/AcrR family transcriptional regulator [Georgenia thermotolerans]KAE8765900.1 TetR family transcriptional regulator [Georgenia thermotolerans]